MADQQSYVLDGRFTLGNMTERVAVGDYYEATDNQTNQKVQLFITHPTVLPDEAKTSKAKNEMEAVSKAGVTGVDPLIHVNTLPDGRLFTVRGGLKSAPLASRISQGTINYVEAAALLESLVSSLSSAATVGVFHRELGPNNVIFLSETVLGCKNFGIAQPLGNGLFGDPWFMSPEQAAGQDPGIASTIYSLGCLYYYMVVGLPPFQDADPTILLQRHRQEMPTAPSKARPDITLPESIDAVILKAMAKDPQRRYPTLSSFLEDLRTAINPEARPEESAATIATDPVSVPETPEQKIAKAPTAPQMSPVASSAVAPSQSAATPVSAPTPSQPQAQRQPEPQASDDAQQRSPRRRKRGGFRETLWFKKGEEARTEGPVKAEDLLKVEKGTGTLDDQDKSLEERYRDGSENLSADDRRKFSVRTGQTGVFQAVKVEDVKAAEAKREVVEEEMAQKRKKSKLVMGLLLLVVLAGLGAGGVFAANTILYKNKFKADGITEMEKLLLAVKPAPKPQFLTSSIKDPKALAKSAIEALKAGKFIPATPVGAGDTAAEAIITLINLKDESATKVLDQLRAQFLNYTLSREFAAKNSGDLVLLTRLAKAIEIIYPNHQTGLAFRQMVQFFQTKKGLRFAKKKPLSHFLEMLPYYPPLPNWDYITRAKLDAWMKANKKRGKIKTDEQFALMLLSRLQNEFLKKNDDSVIAPHDDCGMCAYVTLEKVLKDLTADKKLRNRKLKKAQANLPKMKLQVLQQIHTLMEGYVTKKDYRMVKRCVYAISRFFSTTDKKALETMKKVQKMLPPDSLAKVSKEFSSPK